MAYATHTWGNEWVSEKYEAQNILEGKAILPYN